MPLAENMDEAVKRAGEYLAWRRAAKLTASTSQPAAPGSLAEADLLERLKSNHDREMNTRRAAVAALKALPEEMERAGFDSTCVLRLLHFIDGGGGPERAYGEWTETKAYLQRAAIQIRRSTEPDDCVFFQGLLEEPSPPRLKATEMARLKAYLKRPVSMSMMQRAAHGDPAAVAERDRLTRLKEIWDFNKALREQEPAAAETGSATARSQRASSDYEYDVVLSFAGEQRNYVEQVADMLRRRGLGLFYDKYEDVEMWGKDLVEHLHELYARKGRYCVMFISREYAGKVWPTAERRAALERQVAQKGEYILPARFDDTDLPGLSTTVCYIDLRGLPPSEFAEKVVAKVTACR